MNAKLVKSLFSDDPEIQAYFDTKEKEAIREWISTIQLVKGDTGEPGESIVGPQGEPGQSIVGPRGEKGDKGDAGERGERGIDGINGNNGTTGLQGEKGDKGENGINPLPSEVIEEIKNLKGAEATDFGKKVGAKIDISQIRNASSFIKDGIKYKVEELMHGAGSAGSSLTLETNGIPNGSQTLLNLVEGTNIDITDDGLGNITFDAISASLTVTDGSTSVNPTTTILFASGARVTDDGGGEAKVEVPVAQDTALNNLFTPLLTDPAFTSNTTGSDNIAIGTAVLAANTEGDGNTAIGAFSLNKNTTGRINIAVGGGLGLNETGSENVGIGDGALALSVDGDHNVAIGNSTGNNLTTGDWNVAIGSQTQFLDTTGSNQLVIGSNHARLITGEIQNGNVALPANGHLNFDPTTMGDSGYGFRDDSGIVEFKNSGGDWAPFGTGSVAGNDKDIQFNDAGVFGGLDTFTFDKNTNTVTLGIEAATGTVRAPDAVSADTDGGSLLLEGGQANGNALGGFVTIKGGDSDIAGGDAGRVLILGGDGTSAVGGDVTLRGGSTATEFGGNVRIAGGTSVGAGTPGEIYVQGGEQAGLGRGANITFQASDAVTSGVGGTVLVYSGNGAGSDTAGDILFSGGHGGDVAGRGSNISFTAGNAHAGDSDGGNITLTPGTQNGIGIPGNVFVSTLDTDNTPPTTTGTTKMVISDSNGLLSFTEYISNASFVDNEIVSGSGTTFTLANTPVVGSVHVYAARNRLYPVTDFSISGATITTTASWAAGDLLADYRI